MINNVTLVGRMTRDVDLRYTPNGKAVGNTGIAVNRPFKNAQGENEADFINIVVWGKQAENLANYMKKGSQIGLVGRIQTRNYENNEGKRVYVTEVVADNVQFLESKNQGQQQSNNGGHNAPTTNTQQPTQQQVNAANHEVNRQADPFQNDGKPIDISNDDLPF